MSFREGSEIALVEDMRRARLQGRLDWAVLGLIALGTLWRLAYPVASNPLDFLFSDPLRHWNNAEGFFRPLLLSASDAPLYQLFLAALQALAGDARWPFGLVNGLLCAAMPLLFYAAALQFGVPRRAARLALLTLVWLPTFWVIYRFFMVETLLLPLIGGALWLTGRYWRDGARGDLIWSAILWSLAALTHPMALVPAAVGMALAWWRQGRTPVDALQALIILALLATPSALRTHQLLGFSAPFGTSWISQLYHASGAARLDLRWGDGEAYWFTSPTVLGAPLAPLSDWRTVRAVADERVSIPLSPAAKGADAAELLETMRNSGGWLRLRDNGLLFLFTPSWPDNNAARLEDRINTHSRWLWPAMLLALAGLGGMALRRRQFEPLAIIALVFIAAMALQPLVTTEGRMRKPVEALTVLALAALAGSRPERARDVSTGSHEGKAPGAVKRIFFRH